ncbi:MAG TPA: hypothetical protein VFM08_04175 [Nocardioides sp.]|jgi:hypothetical protein|nr:hypothetical protein [Nocardioides sp.]
MTTPENAWAGQGPVLLDIGGDVGALVVAMPASMAGHEVEIRPMGRRTTQEHDHHRLVHVAVVNRPVGDSHLPSLVFGELEEGCYELFPKGRPETVVLWAEVVGGEVTTTSWP